MSKISKQGGTVMIYHKLKKLAVMSMALAVVTTSIPVTDFTTVVAQAKAEQEADNTEIQKEDPGVFEVTMDADGKIYADASEYQADVNTPFSWDNVNMYFVITDRFYNADTSNDHSYGRSATTSTISTIKDTANKESALDTFTAVAGSYAKDGDGSARKYEAGSANDGYLSNSSQGTFHGGDLKGLTKKLNEGYFDELGTNAIWLTAPYEQVHGAICGSGFKHYPYHGYYALDYTEVDENMGTAEDLHEFIDTAHEHGIRVVFDVVMNHSGYPDGYTIAEYYGADSPLLNPGWQSTYFDKAESSLTWEYDYSAVKGSEGIFNCIETWNNSWFTTAWQRMVKGRFASGYTAEENEGDEKTYCSGGLPDFKTESGSQLGIPDILSKKWTKEGRVSKKTKETQAMLSACGYGSTATVKQYLVAWLSNWVREYGVDGFRCDTAKHVSIDCWSDLKTQCNKALKEWRTNNSDKACSKWTDDFWMTGEVFEQGLSMNYGGTDYTQAFDSLINFKFKEKERTSGSNLEAIFSEYATYARSSEKGDPLSYISSHDKGIGDRSANAGTALLLLPGGVQTYYGDETGRLGGSKEQSWRTNMNWSSMNKEILSNWQKIGRFRRGHISVGAGTHKKLADSPYTFSRTYKGKATIGATKETAYQDAVVVALPGSKGTYDITVGDTFADGTEVVDEYSEETYTVSGGKVTGVTCDDNGVILLGAASQATKKAKVKATVKSGTVSDDTYADDTITVEFATENLKNTKIYVNGSAATQAGTNGSFDDSISLTFGEDTAYEEATKIKVTGTSTIDESAFEKEFTYTRAKEPVVGGTEANGLYVRVKKSDFGRAPQIYVYSADANKTQISAAWPGDEMTLDGDYYVYSNESVTTEARVIIHSYIASVEEKLDWRSCPNQEDPDPVKKAVELVKGATDGSFKSIDLEDPTAVKGTVNIQYKDVNGTVIKSIKRVGKVGDSYHALAAEKMIVNGAVYNLDQEENKQIGTFEETEKTVTFVYLKSGETRPVITDAPSTETPSTETPSTQVPGTELPSTQVPATEAANTSCPASNAPNTPVVTLAPTTTTGATQEPGSTQAVSTQLPDDEEQVTANPNATQTVVDTPAPSTQVTATNNPGQVSTADLTVTMQGSPEYKQVVGYVVNLEATAAGGSAQYQYKFEVTDASNIKVASQIYSDNNKFAWTPDEAGKFTVTVSAKDTVSGTVKTASLDYTILAKLSVKQFIVKRLAKLKYQIKASAKGGNGSYKYMFSYTYKGKTYVLRKYSSVSTLKKKFKKKGTYTFTVYIKDAKGKVVKSVKKIKVK